MPTKERIQSSILDHCSAETIHTIGIDDNLVKTKFMIQRVCHILISSQEISAE